LTQTSFLRIFSSTIPAKAGINNTRKKGAWIPLCSEMEGWAEETRITYVIRRH
jgi:hypothetical protein